MQSSVCALDPSSRTGWPPARSRLTDGKRVRVSVISFWVVRPYGAAMREFLAEQYLAAADFDVATGRAGAARRAAEQLTSEGTPVHFVRSIFIPEDETCLHLY